MKFVFALGAAGLTCALILGSSVSGQEIVSFAEPYRDIDVAGPEMGTLVQVHVREGDLVTKGELIAQLSDEVLQASLQVALKAKLARGRLDSATAELRMHAQRVDKLRALIDRKHATSLELARAETQHEIAVAQLLTMEDELAIKAADFDRISAQIKQKRIRSPIAGVVTDVYKDCGEFISASEPVIARVVQLDQLRVEFSVPALQVSEFQVSDDVLLEVGETRASAKGFVEFVSPVVDPQSKTVRVCVRLPNDEGRFRSGDSVWLKMTSSTGNSDSPPVFTSAKRPTRRAMLGD